jgi:hypothetical protein
MVARTAEKLVVLRVDLKVGEMVEWMVEQKAVLMEMMMVVMTV